MSTEARYATPPTVGDFMASNAFVRCIMGPVGSGKSSGCIMEILRRAMEQAPGPDGLRHSRWAVIRNTYPELRDTTRKTFEQWVPAALGNWHEQTFTFTIRFRDVLAEVIFRPLDRPEDVKKLLSLELTGAYINESREVPKAVFDLLQARVGRYPAQRDGGPSWFGIWMDTNPWDADHWAEKHFNENPQDELFRQPSGLSPNAENVENLPPGYYERLCAGKDEEWIDVYVKAKVLQTVLGSIYGRALEQVRQHNGFAAFDVDPNGVFASWDLGIGDSCAIWFWQLAAHGARFLDYYENHGHGASHYFEVVRKKAQEKGYIYARHWLPHDARARTFQTGVSTLEQFIEEYGADKISISPELSVADGLGAGRWLMEQPDTCFHGVNCRDGLRALRAYRYKWNPTTQAFSKQPLHDWASNGADAYRYAALVVKATAEMQPKPKPEPLRNVTHYPVTLDELWEINRQQAQGW